MSKSIFIDILVGGVVFLSSVVTLASGEFFTAKGKARFSPWSTPEYCADAEAIADANAAGECLGGAKRVSDYEQTFLFSGPGSNACSVTATYVCE